MSDEVQFESAQFESDDRPGGLCMSCQAPLSDQYWSINGGPTCESCHEAIQHYLAGGSGTGRFVKATFLGALGGLGGALVYFAVLTFLKLEAGLLSILVGWLVGAGVRKGARPRSGLFYQLLAVVITYLAIVATYVPTIAEALREDSDGASAVAVWIGAALIAIPAPFLAGIENLLGLIIIGVGLYTAWSMNRKVVPVITGPHRTGTPTSVAEAMPAGPDVGT